ncbi:MAG: diguanylate cyclase [Desulforhabdus sp.]|nr:diguanylate cyclase [Desulforhabdus sp.]
MDALEDLSTAVIEALRELSDNRQPLSSASLSKALSSRAEIMQLVAQPQQQQVQAQLSSDETLLAEEVEELRSMLRNAQNERHKQLRELEQYEEEHAKTQEFVRRSLLTMVTLLGPQEGSAMASALEDFKRKLRGDIHIESLGESLQSLRHLVMQESTAKAGAPPAQTSRWSRWFGRSESGKQPDEAAGEYFPQLRDVYLEILKALPRESDDAYTERSSILQRRVLESKDMSELLSMNQEIIAFIRDYAKSVGDERSLVTSFITDIGANLMQIEQHFVSSLSLDTQALQSNNRFNALLDGEMEQIKNSARISKTLAELKGVVSARLEAIRQALEQKRADDQRHWEEARREKELLEQSLHSVKQEIELVQTRTKALELETLLDPLTGIHNRRAYEKRLGEEMQRFRRYGQIFSLLILDIDHFKNINDQHGHVVGDRCLKEMVARIGPILRECDFLARYGGEEFVVLLPGIDSSHAFQVGEKLRLTIERTRFQYRGKDIPFTISIGVSAVQESDGDAETLFQRVDKAVYEAKRIGRNRTVTF